MSPSKTRNLQYAALPYRRRPDASLEVMLITSRDTGRWVIPKGWPITGLGAADSAAREAHEEAGLAGRIGEKPIGAFHYNKKLANGSTTSCAVEVFPLEVDKQLKNWPERAERITRWFDLQEAAGLVQEPELQELIRKLAKLLAK